MCFTLFYFIFHTPNELFPCLLPPPPPPTRCLPLSQERQLLQLQLERAHFDISRAQQQQPGHNTHSVTHSLTPHPQAADNNARGSSSGAGGSGDALLAQYMQLKQQMAAGRGADKREAGSYAVKERTARGSAGSVPTAAFLVSHSEGGLYSLMGAGLGDADVAGGRVGRGAVLAAAGRVRAGA